MQRSNGEMTTQVQLHQRSKLLTRPTDSPHSPLAFDTWYAPTASGTLISLRAILEAGAEAHFTRDAKTITFPDGATQDFGFEFDTTATPSIVRHAQAAAAAATDPVQTDAADSVPAERPIEAAPRRPRTEAGPCRINGTPYEIWRRFTSPNCTDQERVEHFAALLNQQRHAEEFYRARDAAVNAAAARQGNDDGQR
jgi:hypothetical protein